MKNKRVNGSKKSKQVNKYLNEIKKQKGITLISLVVTIIVLLILAGVSINAVFSNDGIIKKAQEAQSKMNEAVQNDMEEINELTNLLDSYMNGTDSNGESSSGNNSTGENETKSQWNQSKTTVTNGTVTYEVGDDYTYDAGITDGYTGGWKVLGAEEGKLLIITAEEIGTLTLEGIDGWNNGITYLNNFCKEKCGENARSINVDDVNRITGYNPLNQGDGTVFKAGTWNEYKNEVTYMLNETTSKNGLNYTGGLSNNTYQHPDGRIIGSDGVTQITEIGTYYSYYITTLTQSKDGEILGIETDSKAYQMLSPEESELWIATNFANTGQSATSFDICGLNNNGAIHGIGLWNSKGTSYERECGVRGVIEL